MSKGTEVSPHDNDSSSGFSLSPVLKTLRSSASLFLEGKSGIIVFLLNTRVFVFRDQVSLTI